MSWWVWYLIGAGVGLVLYFLKPIRAAEFSQSNYKLQGLLVVAVLSAAIYGTVLWLVFGVVLNL